MKPLPDSRNLVACACHREKITPDRVYLVQPMGGGDANIRTWTWREAVGEARCMAAIVYTSGSTGIPQRRHAGFRRHVSQRQGDIRPSRVLQP